ncbi:MAG: creatininase family protein [Armatimonadetes bacterium]|nr:creatininase family protein [Armatimonadota bacterium]
MNQRSHNLMELTAQEVAERMKETDIVLVPVGSHEKHGYHLPLGCDSYQAFAIAKGAAEQANVLHTNVIWTGYSPHHMHRVNEGTGTITLRGETLRRVLYDVARSLIFHGFNKIVYVNMHGSNIKVMDEVLRRLRYETGAFVAVYMHALERDTKLLADLLRECPTGIIPAWHAGQIETSIEMSCVPELVKMERAVKDTAHAPAYLGAAFSKTDGTATVKFEEAENIVIPMEHHEYCDSATIGDPHLATREMGDRAIKLMVDHCAHFVEAVKKINVEIKDRDFPERAW